MGVRGLTTYIAENAEQYLDPYELHDCNLVIDGDSLSSQLYKSSSQCNSSFGGDYDQYFRHVCNFFAMLKQCNIVPYVLLDGGYLPKKMNTVRQRLRSKIGAIKHLNPFNCPTMFPLMMREVFIEALQHCQVQYMRCLFEADDEVAALARKLKCPVLSYDSDFYIHNVIYIPSVTLTMKVFRRNVPTEGDGKMRLRKDLIAELDDTGDMLKFKKQQAAKDATATKKNFCYFMQCGVYRIEHLARNYRMRSSMLPLFAVLLGNDYISASIFRKFYMNVTVKGIGRNYSNQGKRIVALLRWLQHETLESAIEKILGHIEKAKKVWIRQQIEIGIAGYKHEKCVAFEYFGLAQIDDNADDDARNEVQGKLSGFQEMSQCGTYDADDQEDSGDDSQAEGSTSDDNDQDEYNDTNEKEADDENATEDNKGTDDIGLEMLSSESVSEFIPPDWLHKKMLSGHLPRFVMDLMTIRLYVNAPQVENFMLPDCNRISMPILQMIFTILHHPVKNEFRYLTRVQRRTDIMYQRYPSLDIDLPFDANAPDNFETFKLILRNFDNVDDIFTSIDESVPTHLRLFFIAIIYWASCSKHFNVIYVCSLLLCHIQLTSIDSMLGPIRDRRKFDKLYTLTKTKRSSMMAETSNNVEHYLENVTKDECIEAHLNLMELFQLNDKLRKKHTGFTSDILHGFAEFQAIAFHLNCLNVLCGERYPNIEMSKCFNGCFLFNAYGNLKDRPNVQYYIEHFMLPANSMILGLFLSMYHLLETFIPSLSKNTISKRKKSRNMRKKQLREQRKIASKNEEVDDDNDAQQADNNHSDSEFEDLNNQFSRLLRNA